MTVPVQGGAVDSRSLTPYHGFLFIMLSAATLFEGIEAAMFSFAAPDVRDSLDISREQWGFVSSATRLGVIASFILLIAADGVGRRRIMMVTIVGFAVFNTLTAISTSAEQFVVFQFLARLFLTAEYALAVIMVGEEFPDRYRGRAIAILTSLAMIGSMMLAKIQGFVLLEEGAESNLLRDSGMFVVRNLQIVLGLEATEEDWRALYGLSVIPLILIMGLRLGLRETRRFDAVKQVRQRGPQAKEAFPALVRRHLAHAKLPWRRQYRRRTTIVVLLWNCANVAVGPSAVYWVIFAREDVGLSAMQVGDIVFWGYLGGVTGHFLAGWSIDRIGRRWTCAGSYICASLCIYSLYHFPTLSGQYLSMVPTMMTLGAAQTATHIFAMEIFPTEIRATGYGWATNLFGRATEIMTPAIIGLLIIPMGGLPGAISVVVIGPVIGAIVLLYMAPETKGLTLEQIDARFEAHEARVQQAN